MQRYFHCCTVRASTLCAVKECTRLSRTVRVPTRAAPFLLPLEALYTHEPLFSTRTQMQLHQKTQSLPQTPKTFHRLFLKTHKTLIKAHTTPFSTHSRSHSQSSDLQLPILHRSSNSPQKLNSSSLRHQLNKAVRRPRDAWSAKNGDGGDREVTGRRRGN